MKTFKRLMAYIVGTYKVQFAFVLVGIIVSAIGNVSATFVLRYLIDDYITPFIGQKNPQMQGFLIVLAFMAGAYLIGVVFTWVYSRLMVNITQGVMKRLRDEMFLHMQTLPIRYFDANENGDVMSHYTNDTDTLRQMISQSIPQCFSSFVTMVSVFVSMLTLSVPMTLLITLMLVVMVYITKYIGGHSGKYFGKQQKDLGAINGYIEEMMTGQKVIKVFCHEEKCEENFDILNEQLCVSATKANSYANILMPIMVQLGNLIYVVAAVFGAFLSISGIAPLTLGMLASFLQFTRSLTQPISQVSQQMNAVVMALAGAKRIFALLDEESELDEGYVTLVNAKEENNQLIEVKERTGIWAWKHPHQDGQTTLSKLEGDVLFEGVDFGYNEEKIILKNMSLFAKPGEKIAFVGATGAGKTTITNLINRFYDINDGKIRYDGINIQKIKKADLRRSLGIVLQDTHLFTGSVMENIRMGKLDATNQEVLAAAKLANAHYFIEHLPNGYETIISGDGSNLSQGQRQLLAIARAAVADPPVLILDEATSSIDTRTEAIVQKGMDQLMHGRTVFVIAHRLSTVRNSDVIMVLEQGEIIERGNHEALIEQKGKYHQLYTGAFAVE